MIKISSFLLIILSTYLFAQKVSVENTIRLNIDFEQKAAHPIFSADDSRIIFTTPNYHGLYSYDPSTGKVEIISEKMGSGYSPRILEDEKLYYKSFRLINGRKLYSIERYDMGSGKVDLIESNIRLAKIPFQRRSDHIIYLNNSVSKIQNFTRSLAKNNNVNIAIYSENNDLNVLKDDEKIVLNPLGKGVYVWETISPDGELLLFSFGNQGAFLSDLNGDIVLNIEEAHYPRFSPNGRYISYMKDKDDGHHYTESDIFIYSLEDDETYQITDTGERIEMYPEWSTDGTKIVYHTIDGELFISELKFEN